MDASDAAESIASGLVLIETGNMRNATDGMLTNRSFQRFVAKALDRAITQLVCV